MTAVATHPPDVTMAVVMARQIRDGDFVSHGASVPLAAAALYLAMEVHAPNTDFWLQGSITPSNRSLLDAIVRPQAVYATAVAHFPQTEIINYELRGNGLFQFLRPAQIDPLGNVNASRIGSAEAPKMRFHGIAVGDAINEVRRTCLYVPEHSPRVLVEKLDYMTGAGHLDGSDWRPAAGIHDAGPVSVVTPLALLGFSKERRLEIRSVHQGMSIEDVQGATGFELGAAADVQETPAPTADELEALERVDPDGVRKLEFREHRDAVLRWIAEAEARA
jgi:glutaconate CoA-transferase subunit B